MYLGIPYYQKGGFQEKQDNPTIAQRKQSSNCYHCGQPGHWVAEYPIKDIPPFDPEFWNDLDNFAELEPKGNTNRRVPTGSQGARAHSGTSPTTTTTNPQDRKTKTLTVEKGKENQ